QFKKFHDKEAAEHFLNGFATVKVVADVEANEELDWGDTSDGEILDAVKLFESTQSIKIDGKVNLKNVELIGINGKRHDAVSEEKCDCGDDEEKHESSDVNNKNAVSDLEKASIVRGEKAVLLSTLCQSVVVLDIGSNSTKRCYQEIRTPDESMQLQCENVRLSPPSFNKKFHGSIPLLQNSLSAMYIHDDTVWFEAQEYKEID
ncbi:unnamed protein product, partial [Didymodactylos carnosus]